MEHHCWSNEVSCICRPFPEAEWDKRQYPIAFRLGGIRHLEALSWLQGFDWWTVQNRLSGKNSHRSFCGWGRWIEITGVVEEVSARYNSRETKFYLSAIDINFGRVDTSIFRSNIHCIHKEQQFSEGCLREVKEKRVDISRREHTLTLFSLTREWGIKRLTIEFCANPPEADKKHKTFFQYPESQWWKKMNVESRCQRETSR